jgi:hypothetical protein
MKLYVFIFCLALMAASCQKDDSQDNNNTSIQIKGKIDLTKGDQHAKSLATLSLADAKKVLIFDGIDYTIADITNGSFSVSGTTGCANVLAFLDSSNGFIGLLCTHGLNMLPLVGLKDGDNTVIDLSTLTMPGDSVVPFHDPFGDEINITQKEIETMKALGGYYESLSKNIDADADGIPDIIDKKQLTMYTQFAIFAGKWGINSTLPTIANASDFWINYKFIIKGGSGLSATRETISLSGPSGSEYTDIKMQDFNGNGSTEGNFLATFLRETSAGINAPWGSAFLPFKKGIYSLNLGDKKYALNYSNIDAKYNMVLATPTLHTNSEGKLTSITLEYKLPDNSSVNPKNILKYLTLQLNDPNYNRLFDSEQLTADTGYDAFTFKTPLDITSLYQIDVFYIDLLGNEYAIIWR